MQDPAKKLSRPTKEAERAAALRENLKKRKAQGAKPDKDAGDDAKSEDDRTV